MLQMLQWTRRRPCRRHVIAVLSFWFLGVIVPHGFSVAASFSSSSSAPLPSPPPSSLLNSSPLAPPIPEQFAAPSFPLPPPPTPFSTLQQQQQRPSSSLLRHAGTVSTIRSTNKHRGGQVQHYALRSNKYNYDPKSAWDNVLSANGRSRAESLSTQSAWLRVRQQLWSILRATFLPSSFPAHTPTGYLKYAVWSCIQDVSTQLRSVLATQRILLGVGVGRPGATALSAVLHFLMRDAAGMVANLVFTSRASSQFKSDVKRWRLFADIMVDLGITLEVAAAQMPSHLFVLMISVGNMCKAVCGVASGACNGPLHWHWAGGRAADLPEIAAKFGAQNTITASVGIVAAALVARWVASDDSVSSSSMSLVALWTLYTVLTALHLFANRTCMRLVAFSSLNTVRFNMVLDEFFSQWAPDGMDQLRGIPTPEAIAKTEPLFFLPSSRPIPIQMGVSWNDLAERSYYPNSIVAGTAENQVDTNATMSSSISSPITTSVDAGQVEPIVTNRDSYWVGIGVTRRHGRGQPCILLALSSQCTPAQHAKAYVHGALLRRYLLQPQHNNEAVGFLFDEIERAAVNAKNDIDVVWNLFVEQCQAVGWDVNTTELHSHGYEIDLEYEPIKQKAGIV